MKSDNSVSDSFTRFFGGSASSDDLRQLDQWRKSDPANEQEFQDLKEFFEKASPNEGQEIPDFTLDSGNDSSGSKSTVSYRFTWWNVAAGLILFAGFFGIWSYYFQSETLIYTGEKLLPDSSLVNLSPGSELREIGNRTYRLKGTGWFEVRKLPVGQPFTVYTQTAVTKVLGTRFLIDADSVLTTVTVLSGLVEVSPASKPDSVAVILPSGGETTIDHTLTETLHPKIKSQNYIQWSNSGVTLHKIPVFLLMREISLQYHVTIVMNNSEFSWQTISGVFESSNPEYLIDQVCKLFGLSYEKTVNGFTIGL